ncbi:hypothetical protein Tco_1090077 [Tanacetum coccineum]|uniref:Uncharacterized protein n=1 Tax=Tanacetum coccineum TaxID=301880 RepID=A0ABQ5I4F8_9ASTR
MTAACFVAAGYLVSAGTCFCCYSILLLCEDLSRNLELTESTPTVPADSSSSIPADDVPADSSSSVPADYVSAADTTVPSQQELDLLFGPLYDEFFTAGTSNANNSSSPIDSSKQQDTPPTTNIRSSTEPTSPTTNVNAEENNDNQAADT